MVADGVLKAEIVVKYTKTKEFMKLMQTKIVAKPVKAKPGASVI